MPSQDLRFDGKVALVTGGGRGLGKAYAMLLAARGARVAINNRSADNAHATAEEIRRAGGDAVAIVGDLGNPEAADDCVARTVAAFGGLDILINNAGGVARLAAFAELAPEDRDDTLRQNLISAWDVTRAAWRHIVASRGRIIFTTSPGFYGSAQAPHYAVAKAGIVALTRSLAVEGAPLGLHVNAISPVAATPAAAELAPNDDQRAFFAAHFPAESCAAAVAWLAHASCVLNGEILSVAGARVARAFLSETDGWSGDPASFAPETVAANIEAILRTENATLYRNSDEVMADLGRRAAGHQA